MTDDEPFDPEAVVQLPMDGVLDLHTFSPRDVADLVPTWLDECHEHGLYELREPPRVSQRLDYMSPTTAAGLL